MLRSELGTSLNKYARQRRRMLGFETRWCRGKLAAPNIGSRICQNSQQVTVSLVWGGGIERKKGSVERREGGRQNWNFFARATTQQLIKSLNVSLLSAAVAARVSPSFPNINSLYPLYASVDWLPRLSPFTLILRGLGLNPVTPHGDAYGAGNFYPEKLGALLTALPSPSRFTPRDIAKPACVSPAWCRGTIVLTQPSGSPGITFGK